MNIPMNRCSLWVSCSNTGTWLHFESVEGPTVAVNVDALMAAKAQDTVGAGLRQWCAERQKQAKELRVDSLGALGIGGLLL
jgi:hypothetical protein